MVNVTVSEAGTEVIRAVTVPRLGSNVLLLPFALVTGTSMLTPAPKLLPDIVLVAHELAVVHVHVVEGFIP